MALKVTKDHEKIRAWAEKYQGKPVIMDYPEAQADEIGLRIDFPGKKDEAFLNEGRKYKQVTWEEFFKVFDRENLSFEYLEDEDLVIPDWDYRFVKSRL